MFVQCLTHVDSQCALSLIVSHSCLCLYFYIGEFFKCSLLCTFVFASVIFMLPSLCHVSLSISFAYRMLRCPYSLHIVNVVFTHVSSHTMCIRSLWWFQWLIFVKRSWYYYLNTYRNHSKSFKHCCTSVITIVTKCIFIVSLVVKSSQRFHIEGNMLLTCSRLSTFLFHKVF